MARFPRTEPRGDRFNFSAKSVSKPVDFGAKAVYFVAAHAVQGQNQFDLRLTKLNLRVTQFDLWQIQFDLWLTQFDLWLTQFVFWLKNAGFGPCGWNKWS